MDVYADTNFLTRFYLESAPSESCGTLLNDAVAAGLRSLPISWLLRLEFTNSIELSVFVSRNTGRLRVTPEMASVAQANFLSDLESGRLLRREHFALEKVETTFVE